MCPSKRKNSKPAARANENGPLQVSVLLMGRIYVYWDASETVLLCCSNLASNSEMTLESYLKVNLGFFIDIFRQYF